MNIIQRILNPNKPFEDLFREIHADEILFTLTNKNSKISTSISIANFYKFRELLIKSMYEKNPELLKTRLTCLNDYQQQFGMYWIKGVMEDTYSIKMRIFDEF